MSDKIIQLNEDLIKHDLKIDRTQQCERNPKCPAG